MTSHSVECLRCGAPHLLIRAAGGRLDHGECPRCGYVGWTPVRALRRVPLRPSFGRDRLRTV